MWAIITPALDYLAAHPYVLFAGLSLYVFIFFLSLLMNGKKPGRNPFTRSTVKEPAPLVNDPKLRDKVIKQGFGPQKVPEKLDAVIIGSGIGGLTAGVLLSKAGKKVLVLEQHDQAGGCCHTYVEKGFEFDVGIHYIGEMTGTTLLKCIMDFLTDGQLLWDRLDDNFDTVAIGEAGKAKKFPMYAGRKQLIQCLKEYFPQEHKAIDKFFDLCQRSKGTTLMFVMLKTLPKFLANVLIKTGIVHLLSNYFRFSTKSLKKTLDELTDDADLKAVLSYSFGDYGTVPGKVGFAMHASLVNHFIHGSYYPRGGASEVAFHMVPIIERGGGRVLVRASVSQILINDKGKAFGVRVTKGGNDYDIYARTVISAAGITTTLTKLLPKEIASKSVLSSVLTKVDRGVACMSVFVGLNGTTEELGLKAQNLWAFTRNDQTEVTEEYMALTAEEAMEAEVPLLFVNFPSARDSSFQDRYPGKSTCTIITLTNWEWFSQWENERVKHRGTDYEAIKEAIGKQMWRQTLAHFPQLEGKVEFMEVGTPVSNNYYIGSSHGEIYGLDHGMKRFSPECVVNLRSQTDIPGLLLAGQDVFTCGFAGGMFGGIAGASAALHRNVFRDAIAYQKRVKLETRAKKTQ